MWIFRPLSVLKSSSQWLHLKICTGGFVGSGFKLASSVTGGVHQLFLFQNCFYVSLCWGPPGSGILVDAAGIETFFSRQEKGLLRGSWVGQDDLAWLSAAWEGFWLCKTARALLCPPASSVWLSARTQQGPHLDGTLWKSDILAKWNKTSDKDSHSLHRVCFHHVLLDKEYPKTHFFVEKRKNSSKTQKLKNL